MLTCQRCHTDFTKDDQESENIQLDWNGASGVEPAHLECPEPLKDTYNFVFYLHNNYDHYEVVEVLTSRDMPEAVAEEIAEARPFYEVKLECTFDRTNGKTTVNKVTL